MLGAMAIGALADVRSGRALTSDVLARRMFGGFVALILLTLLARPAPRVATGLSILALIATLIAEPEALTGLAGGEPAEPPSGPPNRGPRNQ